jgi:hypothetical protein
MSATQSFATGGNMQKPVNQSGPQVLHPTPPRDSTYLTHPLPVTANPRYGHGIDAKRALMKDYVAPGLRKLGFKGTGNNYLYTDPDYFININFQQTSMWPGAAFYINITVQDRANWVKENGDKPYRKAYGDKFSSRINTADRKLPDHWSVFGDTDIELVADMILGTLEHKFLPKLFKKIELLRANPTKWLGTSL